jgi:hypothetical protein
MSVLYITFAAAIAAAIALPLAIRTLLRKARISPLATLSVAPAHVLDLPSGPVVLHLSGPLGTTKLGGLSFQLCTPDGGAVPSSAIVVRSRRSSALGRVMVSLRRFQLPVAGSYRLQVDGIATNADLSDCRLVLARPQDAGMALSIVGVVVAAVVLVVASVLSLILLLSPAALAAPASTTAGSARPVAAATPPPNSAERRALLNAVRERAALVANTSRLRVHHLKVAGRWAYFVGTETVAVPPNEWQETDLSIEALLERDASRGWRVAEYWSLPTEHLASRRAFVSRVRSRLAGEGLPAGLVPATE